MMLANTAALYWATEPNEAGEPASWTPYCPSAMSPERMDFWSHGKVVFDDISADEVYMRDVSLLSHLW